MDNSVNIKISIVIPVYKVKEEYLRCCLDSCLGQTYSDLEIIFVDDGSPDLSGQLCDEFARMDPRVRVIHQKNSGSSAARNAGIMAATGNWITFLDADDYLERDTCQQVVEKIRDCPDMDLVAFSLVKDYEERYVNNQSMYNGDVDIFGPEAIRRLRLDVLEKQLDSNILRMTFCKAVRTQIVRDNGIWFNPQLPLCEDVVFWFETMQHVNRAYYIDQFLYHYRQVSNSASLRYRPDVEREHAELLASLKKLIAVTDEPEIYEKGFSLEAFYSMQRMITQGFYHSENPASYFQRAKACRQAMAAPVYREALPKIVFTDLTTNHKIKYVILRMHFYGSIELLRNLFGVLTKRKTH